MIFRLQLALWLGLFSEKLWVGRKTRRVNGAWPPACAAGTALGALAAVSVSSLLLGVCLVFATTGFSCNIYRLPGVRTLTVRVLLIVLSSVEFRVTDQGRNRTSTFAHYKYLMFCEPVSLLLWTRLSITARSVPSSPADTLLMEALFFLEKDVFCHAVLKKQTALFAFYFSLPSEGIPSFLSIKKPC